MIEQDIIQLHMSETLSHAWIDIDGTLLGKKAEVMTESVVGAFCKVPKRGVNTNRGVNQAEKVVSPSLVNLPNIVLSGAEIWYPGTEMMKSFPLCPEERRAIAETTVRNSGNLSIGRFYPDGKRQNVIYVSSDGLEAKYRELYSHEGTLGQMVRDITEFARMLEKNPTSMVVLRPQSKEGELDISPDLKRAVFVNKDSKDVVITRNGVNKGSTLVWLCGELGVDLKNVLTAGDTASVDSPAFMYTYGVSVGDTLLPYAKTAVKDPEELAKLLSQLFAKG